MSRPSEVTRKNIDYFDKTAEQYDLRTDYAEASTKAANAMLRLDKHGVMWNETAKVLDFACGTGFISRTLAPHAGQIIGVDTSPKMCEKYNERAHNQGIAQDEMKAICVDLLNPVFDLTTNPELSDFDNVVVSMAYHHFENIDHATESLVHCLKKGGYLIVVDIENENFNAHTAEKVMPSEAKTTVSHHGGFTKSAIWAVFDRARLHDIGYEHAFAATREGHKLSAFVVWGRK